MTFFSIAFLLLTLLVIFSDGAFQRTVVFIRVDTDLGETVFLRGGGANSAIPIRHRVFPVHGHITGASFWSKGDNNLDWNGAEFGQSLYQNTQASGTPLIWTTSLHSPGNPTVAVDGFGYTPLNTFGSNFWMLDVDMDCSKTYRGGWFAMKVKGTLH
ncbi:alpha-amylase-like [Gigantopelta aegis]|uniref:alpha-amylase-like n=1 Tax=Gigantopelta aegis TaxID=1735272 RepID=UPI001B888412|nr:alpha-amylase-like [Gigantopelta aegis]